MFYNFCVSVRLGAASPAVRPVAPVVRHARYICLHAARLHYAHRRRTLARGARGADFARPGGCTWAARRKTMCVWVTSSSTARRAMCCWGSCARVLGARVGARGRAARSRQSLRRAVPRAASGQRRRRRAERRPRAHASLGRVVLCPVRGEDAGAVPPTLRPTPSAPARRGWQRPRRAGICQRS